jgi:drug/metabolite transporter (DMT)-like permease
MFWRILLLAFGLWACATSVIFIKACRVPPVLLASYRLLVAAAALSPLFVRDLRRHRSRYTWRHVAAAALPGAVLGVHFITWIAGARRTLAANASLIVNMVPLVMPLLLHAMLRERPSRREGAGTAVAMAGVALLAGLDYHLSAAYFRGDLICFGSMLLFAVYLALGRGNRHFPSLWLYVVPVYLFGGVICFAASLPLVHPLAGDYPRDLWMILGLGIVPTVMGHSILNYSMKHFRGQFVAVANLGQFIFAGAMAFALLSEVPQWNFYVAAVLVIGGAWATLGARPRPSRQK